jgi:hypothetical protein
VIFDNLERSVNMKETELVNGLNLDNLNWYTLISNYGFTFTINDNKFDVRHWLNDYGFEVDYWSITDLSKWGTKGCSQTFKTLEETIEYIKTLLN